MSLDRDIFYTTSSFINWLREKRDCEIYPLSDKNVIRISNGMMKVHIYKNSYNRIDYDEIWRYCSQLQIDGLPSPKELEEWHPPEPKKPKLPRRQYPK